MNSGIAASRAAVGVEVICGPGFCPRRVKWPSTARARPRSRPTPGRSMYTTRMSAAPILDSLPAAFATAQYRDLAGITTSSASRALRHLAERGLVQSAGRGWWYRSRSGVKPAEVLLGTPAGMWTPDLECILDALFGASDRRIAYLSGLDAAGIPLTFPLTVATSTRASERAATVGITHVREPANSIHSGVRRFTERTLVSEPQRALLECAQFPHHAPRCEEYIGYAVCWGAPEFSPDAVRALGVELGWWAGMRRISSIAAGLSQSKVTSDIDVSPARGWAELVPTARRGDRWINVNSRHAQRYAGANWADAARRVHWWTTPSALARQIVG